MAEILPALRGKVGPTEALLLSSVSPPVFSSISLHFCHLRAFIDGFNTNTYGSDWKSVLEQNLAPHSINQPQLPAKVSPHSCGRQIKWRLTDPKNAYAVETHHPPETCDMEQSYVARSCIPDPLHSHSNASCFHNPAMQLLLFNGYIYKKSFGPSCVPP